MGGIKTIGTLKHWVGLDKWRGYLAQRRAAAAAAVVQDQGLESRIATADLQTLEGQLVPQIRVMELTEGVRAQLAAAVRDRFKALNAPIPIEKVRRMLNPPRAAVERADEAPDIDDGLSMAPAWAREWAWIRSEEKFIHRRTKLSISKTAFDTEMQKHVGDLLMEQNDSLVELKASERMFKHWGAKTADKLWYQPAAGELAPFVRIPMKPTTCSTGMHATHSIPNSAIYPDRNPASDSTSKSAIESELFDQPSIHN